MKCKTIFFLLIAIEFFSSLSTFAVPVDPRPLKYTQPDGSVITIRFYGDEVISWAETMDGFKLINNGKNGYEYATLSSAGDLQPSGVIAHEADKRTMKEIGLLKRVSKGVNYSQQQISKIKSSWEASTSGTDSLPHSIGMQKISKPQRVFSPSGSKKLLLILIDFTDQPFNSPLTAHNDFNELLNTEGYSNNGKAHGSVRDFFYESSYKNFDLTTTVAGPYHAKYDMAHYGATGANGAHDTNVKALITEAVLAANADVNYAEYANEVGEVEGVYVIYAGYGEATSPYLTSTIWPHAGSITTQTLDGVKISKYSCSNELEAGGTDITTIGVICHEFGHVCGAKDFYDTNYATDGQFKGTGYWDVMATGVYNGTPSGSSPAHFNPYVKIQFNWASPTLLTSNGTYTTADISSTPSAIPQIYKYNTKTDNEYFLIENRQQTRFNIDIPGHGLMVYHVDDTYIAAHTASNNIVTGPHQGLYPVCASATSAIPTSDPASFGDINSTGCPFPGSSGKTAFYDTGTPSAKSWSGVNTGMPLTKITENADNTVSFTIETPTACTPTFTTQASTFTATPQFSTSMNISWTRGGGNKVLVVAHEGSVVDCDPLNGATYTANANFKTGDEIGWRNYVVYNGSGTSVSLTGLSGGTSYYFSVYEYVDNCYLTPALTGVGTTNCNIDVDTFTEDFERDYFGCWTTTDNTGEGNWKIGTTSNTNLPPDLSGNYAYFKGEFNVAHNYNTDLISPVFDLSSYTGVTLNFKHHFDAANFNPSTGTVMYSIDNGSTWNALASYTSDQNNTTVSLNLPVAAGQSQVKFKWNYTCSPTGAFMWAVDNIQIKEVPENPSSITAIATSTNQINLNWTKNTLNNDVIIAYSSTNIFGTPANNTIYSVGASLSGGGTVLYKGNLTDFNHTDLTANTTYYYKIWSVSATNKYSVGLTPVSETTDCNAINTLPFEENFNTGILPNCWKIKDNTGQGNWQFGTTSNTAYPLIKLTAPYAYFKSEYGVAHNYNADLISPALDLSAYSNVVLKFNHLFDRSSSYPSTATVSYSIDNGVTWAAPIATYSSTDSPNPEAITLSVSGVAGESQVKFKWNYTCSPTGAFFWAIDNIIVTTTDFPTIVTIPVTGLTSTSAVSGGNAISAGASAVTSKGVCWSTSPDPTVNENKTTDGTGAGAYRSSITGLTPNTTYYVRAYATNANGTNYGAQAVLVAPPVTTAATTVTASGFTTNWVASSNAINYSLDVSSTPFGNTALFENFNGFSQNGTATVTPFDNYLQNQGWTSSTGLYERSGYAFVNNYSGQITTPSINLSGNSGNYTLWVDLKKVDAGTTMKVLHAADGINFVQIGGDIIISDTWTTKKIQITGGTTQSKLRFATIGTTANRFYLDNIRIEASNMLTGYNNLSVNGTSQAVAVPSAGVYYYRVRANGTNSSTISSNVTTCSIKTSTGGNWSANATWSPSGVPLATDNVVIVSPGTVTVDANPAVCNDLSIQSGATMNIAPAKALTVNGTFTNNAGNTGFLIQSSSTGTGTFLDNATAQNTAIAATVQQYLSSERNWYMSLPVSTFTVPSSSDYTLYYYPESDANQVANSGAYWVTPTGSLTPTTGYIVKPSTANTGSPITFTGILNTGLKTSAMLTNSTTNNPIKHGYNLVGNPYPSYLNVMTAINSNDALEKTVWYKTRTTGTSPIYLFETVNTESGLGTNISATGTVTGYIPPMQSFWVKVNAETTLTFDNNMRSHANPTVGEVTVPTTPMKVSTKSNSSYQVLRFKVSDGTSDDEAIVYFNDNASDSFDKYDSRKMSNGNKAISEIFTKVGNEELVINGLNSVLTTNEFHLGLRTGTSNNLSIQATEISNFEKGTQVILKNNQTGEQKQISDGNAYTFYAPVVDNDAMFTVTIKAPEIVDELHSVDNQKVIFYGNANKQIVVTLKEEITHNAVISIYNALGQKIIRTNINTTTTLIDVPVSGIYLVTVSNNSKDIIHKIIIK